MKGEYIEFVGFSTVFADGEMFMSFITLFFNLFFL